MLMPPEVSRFDASHGLDEGDRVSLMLFDSRCDSEDVRIEDDVLRCEAFLEQDRIGP